MQRFTYTEPRNLLIENDDAVEHDLIRCMGSCDSSVPAHKGGYIDQDFYCNGCRVCVSCGHPAVMDEGLGMTCSPARLEQDGKVVCNGKLAEADAEAERINEAKDQLDWDNGAYRGGSR